MDEEKTSQLEDETKPASTVSRDDATEIATLLRDSKTGKLLVEIGEQRYADASDLDDQKLQASLIVAASDFTQWLKDPESEKGETIPQEEEPKPTPKLKSMIDEINEILEKKSAEGKAPLGLRLLEEEDGTLRVFVGVKGYAIEEVPDKKVQRVIKEAVAEWEALQ
ncbi:MAG: hypothetical protein PVI78_06085 [Anaerolineales bacterium]|jgi:hypothetical protein